MLSCRVPAGLKAGFDQQIIQTLKLPNRLPAGIALNSTGTVAQIRSSANATPAKLGDTAELSPPTPLQPGHNVINVNSSGPTTFVLVWISTLGSTGGKKNSGLGAGNASHSDHFRSQ